MPLSQNEGALLISERAVGTDQDAKYLLVVNDQNVVEYRPVKLGPLSEGLRVIEKGVSPGEWVITSGIQRVRPGITVKPQQTATPGQRGAGAPAPAEVKEPASPPA
jgi:multidrug efflux system membrane fusion protein